MKDEQVETCVLCGGTIRKHLVHEFTDEKLIGLPGVVLADSVWEGECDRCGEEFTSFPNLAGLLATAALSRVKIPIKLNAKEIKFIRSVMDLKASALADFLEVRSETISRWENGREPIGPTSEKLLRLMAWIKLRDAAPLITFDEREIADMKLKSVRSQKKPVKIVLIAQEIPKKMHLKEKIGWDENGKTAVNE